MLKTWDAQETLICQTTFSYPSLGPKRPTVTVILVSILQGRGWDEDQEEEEGMERPWRSTSHHTSSPRATLAVAPRSCFSINLFNYLYSTFKLFAGIQETTTRLCIAFWFILRKLPGDEKNKNFLSSSLFHEQVRHLAPWIPNLPQAGTDTKTYVTYLLFLVRLYHWIDEILPWLYLDDR